MRVKKKGKGSKSGGKASKGVKDAKAALTDEELARKKQEARKKQLKEAKEAEQRYAALNSLTIQHQWRRAMRMTKVDDLKREIEVLCQNHEREVDRRDALVQMLDRDLDEAEEQYQLAVRAHLREQDYLLEIQRTRITSLEAEFDRELVSLEDEFNQERQLILKKHQAEKREALDIMAEMEKEFDDTDHEATHEFEGLCEEIKSKALEELNNLKGTLEERIDELEHYFDNALKTYKHQNETLQMKYRTLKENDQKSADEIKSKQEELRRLQERISTCKTKISNNQRECEERNLALRQEKEIIVQHYQELKQRVNKFRFSENSRLAELTTASRKCTKELQKKLKKGENILKLSELCRKLETEQEKVLPFYKSTVDAEEEELRAREPRASMEDIKAMHSYALGNDRTKVEEWNYLDNFFKKYNKVLLDTHALEQEKRTLARQNEDLRVILKQYLDGISVNSEVLADTNSLLVINDKIQLNIPAGMKRPPPNTIVEATQTVNETAKQRAR